MQQLPPLLLLQLVGDYVQQAITVHQERFLEPSSLVLEELLILQRELPISVAASSVVRAFIVGQRDCRVRLDIALQVSTANLDQIPTHLRRATDIWESAMFAPSDIIVRLAPALLYRVPPAVL